MRGRRERVYVLRGRRERMYVLRGKRERCRETGLLQNKIHLHDGRDE